MGLVAQEENIPLLHTSEHCIPMVCHLQYSYTATALTPRQSIRILSAYSRNSASHGRISYLAYRSIAAVRAIPAWTFLWTYCSRTFVGDMGTSSCVHEHYSVRSRFHDWFWLCTGHHFVGSLPILCGPFCESWSQHRSAQLCGHVAPRGARSTDCNDDHDGATRYARKCCCQSF